ncbi:MAG: tol-pal system protein YbgF [Pseudomonadaceae bacterium]|nr:tol-pal system protein YbgF [Pseudomonadaceae bacterium]
MRAVVVLMVLVLPLVAQAQVFGGTGERLDRLEKRLSALEGRALPANGNAGMAGSVMADLEQRMQELERESSQMNGGVEKLSNAVERLAHQIEQLAKDFDLRLRDLEAAQGGGNVVAQSSPAARDDTPPAAQEVAAPAKSGLADAATLVAVPDGLSAEEHYNRAYAYLTAADYPNAKTWLEAFLKDHPQDKLADNANYWLGEVHLVQNDPKGAVVAFKKGLEAFPKGAKAPANLLKMGTALQQLKQPQLARGAWEKLVKDFPKSDEADKAKANLAQLAKEKK